MAHLIEEYAKSCGVKIGTPILDEHFFPITHKKYCTIDTRAEMPARFYPYWGETIALLKMSLVPKLAIIRIGDNNDTNHYGETQSVGGLSIKQLCHVIKGSSLHISVGGPTMHIASAFGVPSVSLFSNTLAEYEGPVWNKNKGVCLQAKLAEGYPSFSPEEAKPSILSIHPDHIISAAHSLCPEEISEPKEKITFIGELYHHKLLEVVPDFVAPLPILKNKLLNVRYDLCPNDKNLEGWLQTNRCSIISNKILPIDLLSKYKTSVTYMNFICEIGEFPDEDYLLQLQALGHPFKLYFKGKDSPEFRVELNRYFDFNFERIEPPTEWPENISEKTLFHTNKIIFNKDGQYGSKAHLLAKRNDNVLIKSLDFLEEIGHFYLYEK